MKFSRLFDRSGKRARVLNQKTRHDRRRHLRRVAIGAERLEDRRLLASWSGDITTNTTWVNTEVQEITDDVTVAAGATLTIEPGTIVKFHHSNADLFIDGALNAQGTPAQKIIFTSIEDDIGGDTGGDGNATSPAPADWSRFRVRGSANIDHAEIRYGGFFYGSMLQVDGGTVNLSNSVVAFSDSDGVRAIDSDPVLSNNQFISNADAAVSMNLNSNPTISGVTVTNNGINGLQVDDGTLGKNLNWDDPDIVYWIDDDVTVPNGLTLQIGAGQIVKPEHHNVEFFVDGTLDINGTAEAPVVFTSARDDSRGGDTNNDGDATSPAPTNWARIYLRDSSTSNSVDYLESHYGGFFYGANLLAENTDLTITNSLFADSGSDGVRLLGTDAVLTDNSFFNNTDAAISMNLNSNPTISGVNLSGNGINGLQVDTGDLLKDLTWDDPDIVYWIDNDIVVPQGLTLQIGAGQIVKPQHANVEFFVDGTLDINGTAEAPVVFTSARDDSRGGDTNNDGDATSPAPNNWARIYLRDPSTSNSIDYLQSHYGGFFYGANLLAENTDLTVSNSLITDSDSDAIRLLGTDAILTDNSFFNNADAAISMDLNSNPTISGVNLLGNGINGLQVDSGTLAKSLNWDDPDIVYWIDDDVTVPNGLTLQIGAGQIIKPAHHNVEFKIDGTLDIDGTAEAPVVFTSSRDDSFGGDTNNDADATMPAPANWARIQIRGDSSGSTIEHLQSHYGGFFYGSSLEATDTDLSVSNSTFHSSASDGIRLYGTDANLTNNSFVDNALAAVRMDLNSNPTIQGVGVSGNGTNGMVVTGGDLAKDLTWDDPDIVYAIEDDLTVPVGLTLSVMPGQIIKPVHANVEFKVDGTISLDGTANNPIVVTSFRDDTVGGDTNGDGVVTTPGAANWARFLIRPDSENNLIDHTTIRYGGFFYGSVIDVDDSTITLSNSVLSDSASDAIRVFNGTTADVHNNLMFDNGGDGISALSVSQVTAVNNTIDRNDRGVVSDGVGTSVELFNNLITFHASAGVESQSNGGVTPRFNDVFNPDSIDYDGLTDQSGSDGNRSIDPKYFNAEGRQYLLRPGSPAIDSADGDVAPTTDFAGAARFDDPNVLNTGLGGILFADRGALENQEVSTSDVDLATIAVTSASAGTQDDSVTVNWTIENVGIESAAGAWSDAIYLSSDNVWTPDDVFLGQFEHVGEIGPGQSYSASGEVTLPGVLPGDYYFIVRTDNLNQVFEALNEANNSAASESVIAMDLPALPIGSSVSGILDSTGQSKLFKVSAPAGADLAIDLTGPVDVEHELFIRHAALTSRQSFDARGVRPGSADQTISVPDTRAGQYIVMVYGAEVPSGGETFTLTASLRGFGITGVSPAAGANRGKVTITFEGSQFTASSSLQLVDSAGGVIDATNTFLTDSGRISGTFDLAGAPLGLADVRVTNPGDVVVELPDAFDIIDGVDGQLEATARVPSRVRDGRPFSGFVEYENVGDTDLRIPFLSVTTTGIDLLDLNSDRNDLSAHLDLLATSQSGPAGILPPGSVGRIPIFGLSTGQGTETVTVSEGTFPGSAIPWDSLKSSLTPPGADQAEFDLVFNQLRTQIGDDWDAYVDAISRAATLLPPSMGSPNQLTDVFAVEILKARAALGSAVSGRLFLNDESDALGDATVNLVGTSGDVAFVATSLNDGRFTFAQIPDGTYDLTIEGFVATAPVTVEVSGGSVALSDITVTHGTQVSGSVFLDQFGIPAREVEVTAVSDAGVFSTQTDIEGNYTFPGLPAGSFSLVTQGGGFTYRAVDGFTVPGTGAISGVNLPVNAAGSIGGTVSGPGGIPIAGAQIVASATGFSGGFATSGADGTFVVTGLDGGLHTLVISADGFAESLIEGVNLSSGGSVTGVTTNLIAAGDLSGTITSSDGGAAVPYALIALFDGDRVVGAEQADSSGVFDLNNVEPGTYNAVVTGDGFLRTQQSITILVGQDTTFAPTLDPAGRVSGTIQDAGGNPIAGLTVTAARPSDDAGGLAVTDENGDYEIRDLVYGTYDVRVGARIGTGLAYSQLTVANGSAVQTFDATITTSGTISGRVTDASGAPLVNATVRLFKDSSAVSETSTDESGDYAIFITQDGTYDIAAGVVDLSFPVATGINISGGAEQTIDFEPGVDSFSGTLTDETTGDPIVGATVLLSQATLGVGLGSQPDQTTDGDGNFNFDGLAPGDYDVQFLIPGKASILDTITIVETPPGAPQAAPAIQDFAAKPGFALSGNLRTASFGTTIPGGQIDVYRQTDGRLVGTVGTDAAGDYTLTGLPDGAYDIVASGGGQQKATFNNVTINGGDASFNLPLADPTTRVRGTVQGSVGPADGVRVRFTDSTGRIEQLVDVTSPANFDVSTLPPGNYTATPVGDGISGTPQPISVSAGDNDGFILDFEPVAAGRDVDPFVFDPGELPPPLQPSDPGWLDELVIVSTLDEIQNDLNSIPIPLPAKGCEALYNEASRLHGRTQELVLNARTARRAINADSGPFGISAHTGTIVSNAALLATDLAGLVFSIKGAVEAVNKIDDVLKAAANSTKTAKEAAEVLKFLYEATPSFIGAGNKIYGIASTINQYVTKGQIPPATLVLDIEGLLTDITSFATDALALVQRSPNLIALGSVSTIFLGPVNSLIGLGLNVKNAYDDYNKSIRSLDDRTQASFNADRVAGLMHKRYLTSLAQLKACNEHGPDNPDPPPAPRFRPRSNTPINNQRSVDPNDKTGAAGFGDEGFIQPGLLPYLIQFENDPDLGATIPAQEVFITDTLDDDLDLSTFEFTGFGFNNFEFTVPAGLSHFEQTIDLRPDDIDLLVEVTLDVDPQTRVVSMTFRSLDPLTQLLPEDIDAGFLPVNDKAVHNGEGFVTYHVDPLPGLATGTEISNQAAIVFDTNDPILTPTAINTIDIGAPTSSVSTLPDSVGTSFTVNWTGQDDQDGSGIASYDLFVSQDQGPLMLLAGGLTETSYEFTAAERGSTYGFATLARDNVGNVEPVPKSTDSETTVGSNPWVNPLNPLDVNAKDGVTAGDAIIVINALARGTIYDRDTGDLAEVPPAGYAPPYLDVSDDGKLSSIDALRVINFLSRQSSGGLGESEHIRSTPSFMIPTGVERSEPLRASIVIDIDVDAIVSRDNRAWPETSEAILRQNAIQNMKNALAKVEPELHDFMEPSEETNAVISDIADDIAQQWAPSDWAVSAKS